MGRMSELDIEIRERIAARQVPADIAQALNIPEQWISGLVEDSSLLNDDAFFAEQMADADAEMYGTR